MSFSFLPALLAATSLSPAFAQEPPAPAQAAPPQAQEEPPEQAAIDDEGGQQIVVTGTRLRGAVEGNVEPEQQLDEAQIRGYGAATIGELIEQLAPQTRSGRGRGGGQGGGGPVVLLNGRRISGFGEIRDLPPEAIERVDILPEETALSYGFRADQRVVNIVLKENFRSIIGSVSVTVPTAGGRAIQDLNASILRIDPAGRWSVEAQYQHGSALLESERELIQSQPALPFDLIGNVGASPFAPGAEIDPGLSAAAGTIVTVAAVPGSAANGAPTLAQFVPGANRPNFTDLGRFRTLIPANESLSLNGTLNRTLFGNVSATFNARFGATSSESRLGLPSLTLTLPGSSPFSPFADDVTLFRYADVGGPLLRRSRGRTYHGGLTLDGDLSPWRWTLTANYDLAENVTRTDTNADPAAIQARLAAGDPTLNPFAPIGASLLVLRPEDRAESRSRSADAQLVFNGPLLNLPAGPVRASLTLAGDMRGLESETLRGGVAQHSDLSRERGAVQGNFDLPVTSRRDGFLQAVGDFSLNLNLELEHLSDFGTLSTLGYGLRWEPIEPVDISLSMTHEDGAPSMQQLGDPVIVTPNARVFDFTRGETVDVTRIDGGNPALIADSRRVFSARLTIRPLGQGGPGRPNLSIIANYTDSRISNLISSFPVATAEIEAAFPGRFVRDGAGQLVQLDARPVNFARADREELRWGVNFFRPMNPPGGAPGAGGGIPGLGPRGPGGPGGGRGRGGRGPGRGGGGGGGRGGGMGMFGGGGPAGGMQFSLFHTWRFTDEVLIRPGVPVLDYLDGSAFSGRGGRPRHELELSTGFFRNGLGAWVNATWQEATLVRGGAGGAGDLRFGAFSAVNVNLFADLGQRESLVRRFGWLRGTRVSLSISNLFDNRLDVRDENGLVPISYQPDYLDPMGRTIRLGLRKVF